MGDTASRRVTTPAGDPLQAWRQQTMFLLLRALVLVGLSVIGIDILNHVRLGRWRIALVTIIIYSIFVALAFMPNLDARARGTALVGCFLLLGEIGLRYLGLYGVSPTMLIVAVVLSILLLGPRATLVVHLINSVILAVIFGGYGLHLVTYPYEPINHITDIPVLINNALLILGIGGMLTLLVGSLVAAFQQSLAESQAATAELERLTASLESTVAARTSDVRRSAALLRATQHLAQVGGCEYHPASRSLEWTEELYRIHEVPLGTPLRRQLLQQLYPDAAWATLWQGFRKLIADAAAQEFELYAATMHGRRIWVKVSMMAESEGGQLRYLGAVQDITAQKVATVALAQQLRYAEALSRCSQLLLARSSTEADDQSTFVHASTIMLAAVGGDQLAIAQYLRRDHGIKTPFQSFRMLAVVKNPDFLSQRPPTQAEMQDVPPALDVWQLGHVFNGPIAGHLAGHPRYQQYIADSKIQSVYIQPLTIADQRWGHIVVTDHNRARIWDDDAVRMLQTAAEMIVTFVEAREANRELRERDLMLREVGQMARIGGWSMDREPLALRWSEQIYTIHEWEADTPPNVDQALMFYTPEVRPLISAAIRDCVVLGTPWDLELPMITAKGRRIWVRAQGQAVWNGSRVERVRGTLREITARKETELALVRARDDAEAAARARAAFLATMSHEIRTPLNAVIGMAGLLVDTGLSGEQSAYADTIITAGQTLLGVINNILDFSRAESGRLAMEVQPFDLHACLTGALDLVRHEARQKGLVATCSIAAGVPQVVLGDLARLRQVLLNLLSNAVKFTNRGEVVLTADAGPVIDNHQMVMIQVRDTGIGIRPEQLDQIFEPFMQADNSTARRYGGTGLGLAICRQFVALMEGQLTVMSTPKHGSLFTVTLRLPVAADNTSPDSTRPLYVLIVEDNPINQELTRQLVARLGHTAMVVANGLDAINAVHQKPYDVVLMDVQMPDLDGEEATRQIRSRGEAVQQPRIVALTANIMPGDRERFLQAGMDDYLSKPVVPADLRRALAHAPAVDRVASRPSSDSLIDWGMLAQLSESLGPIGEQTISAAVDMFEHEVLGQFSALDASIANNDRQQIQRDLHRLRGGCLQIGARALAECCLRLEQVSKDVDLGGLATDIQACARQTLAELRRRYPSAKI